MLPCVPLGRANAPLRSQVRGENNNNIGGETTPPSNVLREGANIVGIVEDAGSDHSAVGLVSNGVGAAMEGISGRRWKRRDLLSRIKNRREKQAARLCKSLGTILDRIVHPPQSVSAIAKDYREAQKSLEDADLEESKSF